MGLVFCFVLVGMIAYGIWQFIVSPVERAKMLKEMHDEPWSWLGISVWMVFFLMFFGGMIIRPFGRIVIDLGFTKQTVFSIGLFGVFGGLAVAAVISSLMKARKT